MNTAERSPYLEALDLALAPLGFRRRKRDYQWNRSTAPSDREWIHLNFGLSVINPSLGVEYVELGTLLPPEAGAVTSSSNMLTTLSGSQYSSFTPPTKIAADMLSLGLPELTRLRDREGVITRLKHSQADAWPVASRSHRARLLALLLAGQGRWSESLASVAEAEPLPDQLVPNFASFAHYLRQRRGA